MKRTVSEKEKKLFKLFQSLDEMISEAKGVHRGCERRYICGQKGDKGPCSLRRTIYFRDARYEIKRQAERKLPQAASPRKKAAPEKKKAPPAKPFSELTRNEQVRLLKKEGRSIEEISKELSISQGEVRADNRAEQIK